MLLSPFFFLSFGGRGHVCRTEAGEAFDAGQPLTRRLSLRS